MDFYRENPSKAGAAHFGLATGKAKKDRAKARSTEDELSESPRQHRALSSIAPSKRSTMPVLPDSSGQKLNGRDLRGFFSQTPASGKENQNVSSGSPVSKRASASAAAKPLARPTPKAVPPKKKLKTDSDESDFVMEDEGAAETDDGSEGDASDGNGSGSEAEADDDDVSIAEDKKPAAKKQSGWNKNTGGKAAKKSKVQL